MDGRAECEARAGTFGSMGAHEDRRAHAAAAAGDIYESLTAVEAVPVMAWNGAWREDA